MKPMTLKDYMMASKEMGLKFWSMYMVTFMAQKFFMSAVYQPSLVASSTSYHGIYRDAGAVTSGTILFVPHVGYIVIVNVITRIYELLIILLLTPLPLYPIFTMY
jgi:hypothetical protein